MRNIILIIFMSLLSHEMVYSQVNLTLEIHQDPKLLIDTGSDTTLMLGDSLTIGGNPTAIGGSGYYSYFWFPSTFLDNPYDANPNILRITQPSTYILRVRDDNCVSLDTLSIHLSDYHAVHEVNKMNSIQVYPIPTNNYLNIDFGNLNPSTHFVEVIDLNGTVLYSSKSDKKITVLNLEAFPTGYYILKIKNDEAVRTISIIKD